MRSCLTNYLLQLHRRVRPFASNAQRFVLAWQIFASTLVQLPKGKSKIRAPRNEITGRSLILLTEVRQLYFQFLYREAPVVTDQGLPISLRVVRSKSLPRCTWFQGIRGFRQSHLLGQCQIALRHQRAQLDRIPIRG